MSHRNTQGCIPPNHSAEGLQPYGAVPGGRGGLRCWHPMWWVPAPRPHPWENGDVLVGSAPFQHHPSGGVSSWAAPSPWAPQVWGRGLLWGGEKDFPPCVRPSSRAECECLPAAFLIACSMAGVIQRRAEASAATETTMKRKRSLKNSPFINQLNCR